MSKLKLFLIGFHIILGIFLFSKATYASNLNKFTLPFFNADEVVMIEGFDYWRDDCDKKASLKERDECIFNYPDFDSNHHNLHTHYAFDFAREDGLPFIARSVADNGKVSTVSKSGYSAGVNVNYQIGGRNYTVHYGHVNPSVKPGDTVNRGDPLGWTYENQSGLSPYRIQEYKRGGYCRTSRRPRRENTTIYDKYEKICFHSHVHFRVWGEEGLIDPYGVCVNKPKYSCTADLYENFLYNNIWLTKNNRVLTPEEVLNTALRIIPPPVWTKDGKLIHFETFMEMSAYFLGPYLSLDRFFQVFI